MARQALLVTFDEQTDPQLVCTALEDLLRKGALRWVGLGGNNVQVWRTADIARALLSSAGQNDGRGAASDRPDGR